VPQTISRVTAEGVRVDELVPDAPPPSPRTAPPFSPVPIAAVEIPTCTDPRAAALTVIKGLVPAIADQTRDRAASAAAEAMTLLERARLGRDVGLSEFITHAARHLRLERHLIDQADALDRKPAAQHSRLEGAIYDLAIGVGRWEDLEALRGERRRMCESAAAELAEIEHKLRVHLPATVNQAHGSDVNQGWHARGLVHSHDSWIRSYADGFARRAVLMATLARLGRDRTQTGKSVMAAIASAGPASVASAIAPRIAVSTSPVKEAEKTLARITDELSSIDSRTQAWRELDGRRKKAEADLKAAERAVEVAKADSAALHLARAGTGDLGAIEALERLLPPTSGLRVALASCRGTPPELMAAVAMMVETADDFAAREIAWKRGMDAPRHQPIGGDYASGAVAAMHETQQAEYNAYVADDQARVQRA
jgi:hypothetical protein